MSIIEPVNSESPRLSRFISLAVYFYTGVFVIGVGLIFSLHGKGPGLRQAFRLNPILPILGYGLLAAIGVILLTILVSDKITFIHDLEHEFRLVLGRLSLGQCLILALLSGVAEETLFRGGLQPLIGLIPTSLLFGLTHFPLRQSLLPWTIFAFVMGLLLGWLYLATQSLITPIITHGLINLVNLYRLSHNNDDIADNNVTE